MNSFVGRKKELLDLDFLYSKKQVSIAVIKGRRRVGKSRLVQEFAQHRRFLNFSGLAPAETISAQSQREHFAYQLSSQLNLRRITFSDWDDAFHFLSGCITTEPTVILFDEISWMGGNDSTFVPKLKSWFDTELQKFDNLVLVFCGSVSIWIEDNIINSTAFFGRIALKINLEPFTLSEAAQFLKLKGFKGSAYEIYKILSVTGGIPWYLEQILSSNSADENIKRLCFKKDGILTYEYDRIFTDLFGTLGVTYKKIIHSLSSGMKTLADIRNEINYANSGTLTKLIRNLITSGFVSEHYQWSIGNNKIGKQSLYRLCDCYINFYLKYIEPNLSKIQQNTFQDVELSQIVYWQSILGYQIETLLLQNRPKLLASIGIAPSDIVMDNPYLQRKTTKQLGCQIDYLVQTKTRNLFVIEFKFNRRELGSEIIEEVQEKIDKLTKPKGYAAIPVLLHIGGVSESTYEKNYFYKIIDMHDLLE